MQYHQALLERTMHLAAEEQKIDELQAENAQLKAQNAQLKVENTQLREKSKRQRNKNHDLEKKFKKQKHKMQSKKKLKAKSLQIQAENKKLKTDNENLQTLQNNAEELEQSLQDLKKKNKIIKTSLLQAQRVIKQSADDQKEIMIGFEDLKAIPEHWSEHTDVNVKNCAFYLTLFAQEFFRPKSQINFISVFVQARKFCESVCTYILKAKFQGAALFQRINHCTVENFPTNTMHRIRVDTNGRLHAVEHGQCASKLHVTNNMDDLHRVGNDIHHVSKWLKEFLLIPQNQRRR